MENQNYQTQPPPSPNQTPSPINNSSKSKVIPIILGIATVIAIAIGAYILGTKQSQPVVQNSIQTTPTLSPISTIDETANWKTYKDEDNGFSFKYPPEYSLANYSPSDPASPKLLNNRIDWNIVNISFSDCRGGCPVITKTEKITIGGNEATKISGWIGSIGGNIPQSFIAYELKSPKGKYVHMNLWELPRGKAAMSSDYSLDRQPQVINESDIKVFDQILSTFRFTQ